MATRRQQMIDDLPDCCSFDHLGYPDEYGPLHFVETELDLALEAQDGFEDYTKRDISAMRRFIKKWTPGRKGGAA